jgi:hypothetical protein
MTKVMEVWLLSSKSRFVVRAELRTIRNADRIWYGFLFPAPGAFASAEGFGWALIFAMYFSIPAAPIIALVLRGWGRVVTRWR